MTGKTTKRSLLVLLFTFIFILSGTMSSFGAQSIDYTTNGAASNYAAGSYLLLYGKVTDGGQGVPNLTITVDIKDSSTPAKVIYYGMLKTDSLGYFQTNFTIPSGASGKMNFTIDTLGGASKNFSYTLGVSNSFKFVGYTTPGYQGTDPVVTIPASTDKLGLVFNANVNYFNNKYSDFALPVIERNKDCVDLYEKNSSGSYVLVPSSLEMVGPSTAGEIPVSGITYLSTITDSDDKKGYRKDVLYIVPANGLKASTTYKVVIDKDLSANSSATLGSNVTVYFTTAASSTSTSPGTGAGTAIQNPSAVPTVKAETVGNITTGDTKSTLTVDSTKADDILKNGNQTALSIDLSGLSKKEDTQVNVTLPAKVLATAQTEKKPVILNYGEYVMVIPPGSLPVDKELVLEAKPCGTPSADNQPNSVAGLKKFEFSAKDTSGNDVAFKDPLKMQFDIPDSTKKPERLCVYFIDNKTGEWIYAGGRIENGKLTFSPEHYSTYVIAESTKTFSDISTHWAKDSIESMVARQISKGVSETLFAPNKSITRAEFAALLSRALKLNSTDAANTFTDVPANAWYQTEVSKVAAAGIVTGENGKFRPNDNISRQEMAVMLSRACSYTGAKATVSAISYTDKGTIPSWALNGVTQISSMKMMSGYPDGTFGGSKNSTRAEATKTLKAFMDTLGL